MLPSCAIVKKISSRRTELDEEKEQIIPLIEYINANRGEKVKQATNRKGFVCVKLFVNTSVPAFLMLRPFHFCPSGRSHVLFMYLFLICSHTIILEFPFRYVLRQWCANCNFAQFICHF